MNLFQGPGHFLNLINNDTFRQNRKDFLQEYLWPNGQFGRKIRVQQIVVPHIGIALLEKGGFTRLSRSPQKGGCRSSNWIRYMGYGKRPLERPEASLNMQISCKSAK